MRWIYLLPALLTWSTAFSQGSVEPDNTNLPNSENGWYLSPHGTIRILVIFAEVDYDKNPKNDPQPGGSDRWHKGELPTWKDDLFDPFPMAEPKAQVTRYYHDMSLGQFIVLGDHINQVVTVRESEQSGLRDWSGIAWETANKLGSLHTAHGLTITDFDQWTDGGKPGLPKLNRPDDPHSYDHVMVIFRNSNVLTHGQGSTDAGSAGLLFGYPSDTQSRFGAMNGLPFEILKHEFNHLLLGGNNFHSGGGNAPIFTGYFMPMLGGWSMMGAANSSLLTASAWDRDRLGWRAQGSRFRIRAHDVNGAEVNGDLDPITGDTGIFVLQDFITGGDALRIRMPFLPKDVYPQWLWLENHQTKSRNGCPTDKFHYQDEFSCVHPSVPGIYALMQVDKEKKVGSDIYGGYADYLRPVPANGFFDWRLRGDTVRFKCLWSGDTEPYFLRDAWANPLAGNQQQEFPLFDKNNDGKLSRKEAIAPNVEIRNGKLDDAAFYLGTSAQAFTPQGNNRIAMGTNPSSANMLTLACDMTTERNKGAKPDVRTVHLNGISVQLLEQLADGTIKVHVRTGDTRLTTDVRYCADSIVLPDLHGYHGAALTMAAKKTLKIDRSGTPTRMKQQGDDHGRYWFSAPTKFTMAEGARMVLERKAKLQLLNGSVMHLMPGAVLELDRKAKLDIQPGSSIVLHGNASIKAKARVLKKPLRQGRIVEATR